MKNKKLLIFFISLFLNLSFNLFSQEKINPKEKGKEIFEVFKSLNSISNETYLQKFIDIDFLKSVIRENNNIEEHKKNEFLHLSKEIWNEKILSELNSIKSLGKEYKISWNAIKFSDFTYNIRKNSNFGLKKYLCVLVFKTETEKNRLYGIEVDLVEIDNQLFIIEIDDLKHIDFRK